MDNKYIMKNIKELSTDIAYGFRENTTVHICNTIYEHPVVASLIYTDESLSSNKVMATFLSTMQYSSDDKHQILIVFNPIFFNTDNNSSTGNAAFILENIFSESVEGVEPNKTMYIYSKDLITELEELNVMKIKSNDSNNSILYILNTRTVQELYLH